MSDDRLLFPALHITLSDARWFYLLMEVSECVCVCGGGGGEGSQESMS